MRTRQEVKQLTEGFWTAFGTYMSPVVSADGIKINWVNYKTGVKDVRFTMRANEINAIISIEFSQEEEARRQILFNKLVQLRKAFIQITGEGWHWQQNVSNECGKAICRVSAALQNVSILNRSDWPAIISFFKPRLVALDTFWSGYKYAFEQ